MPFCAAANEEQGSDGAAVMHDDCLIIIFLVGRAL